MVTRNENQPILPKEKTEANHKVGDRGDTDSTEQNFSKENNGHDNWGGGGGTMLTYPILSVILSLITHFWVSVLRLFP